MIRTSSHANSTHRRAYGLASFIGLSLLDCSPQNCIAAYKSYKSSSLSAALWFIQTVEFVMAHEEGAKDQKPHCSHHLRLDSGRVHKVYAVLDKKSNKIYTIRNALN